MAASGRANQIPNEKLKKGIFLVAGFFIVIIAYLTILNILPLSSSEGDVLIKIVGAEISGKEFSDPIPARLSRKRPVFVSIYEDGERISCLGYTKPIFSLHDSVFYLAQGMDLDEGGEYTTLITVFDDYEQLPEGSAIPAGMGILVRKGDYEGVVLPTTFTEKNLTDAEALDLASQKAGFERFSGDDFEVYAFNAQIFRSRG